MVYRTVLLKRRGVCCPVREVPCLNLCACIESRTPWGSCKTRAVFNREEERQLTCLPQILRNKHPILLELPLLLALPEIVKLAN